MNEQCFGALEHNQFSYDSFDSVLDEKKFTLATLAKNEKTRILYTYDFGDNWQHELFVEKIGPPETGAKA